MSVQVTLSFASQEEAIAALGRIAGIAAPAQPAVAVEKSPRKPRSDAGQQRGPQQNPASAKQEANPAGAGAQQGAQAASAAAPVAAAPAGAASTNANAGAAAGATVEAQPQGGAAQSAAAQASTAAAAPAAAAKTAEDVQAAVEKLFNAKGFDDCAAVLSRFGVKRGKDLTAEQRAEFIRRAEDIIAGKYAATDAYPA